jgi:hypothetical protein
MTDTQIILAALELAAAVYLDDALFAKGRHLPDAMRSSMQDLHRVQRLSSRIESGELVMGQRSTEKSR